MLKFLPCFTSFCSSPLRSQLSVAPWVEVRSQWPELRGQWPDRCDLEDEELRHCFQAMLAQGEVAEAVAEVLQRRRRARSTARAAEAVAEVWRRAAARAPARSAAVGSEG